MTNGTSRRDFLATAIGAGVAASSLIIDRSNANAPDSLELTCHEFAWRSFLLKRGMDFDASLREFHAHLDENISQIAEAGFKGFMPALLPRSDPQDYLNRLVPLLNDHNLKMPSIFIYSRLYDQARLRRNIDHVRSLAEIAQRELGTEIVVLQPAFIREGDKTDDQLKTQADQLDRLGELLRSMDLRAAYHNLESEFVWGAREFHHMMTATDPANLSFCIDVDRIYQGVGNSQLALLDIIERYGSRVTEIHFRQLGNGHWTESFGEGDIDYSLVCNAIKDKCATPHLVYEQAWNEGSDDTMTALEAHSIGRNQLNQLCDGVWNHD